MKTLRTVFVISTIICFGTLVVIASGVVPISAREAQAVLGVLALAFAFITVVSLTAIGVHAHHRWVDKKAHEEYEARVKRMRARNDNMERMMHQDEADTQAMIHSASKSQEELEEKYKNNRPAKHPKED